MRCSFMHVTDMVAHGMHTLYAGWLHLTARRQHTHAHRFEHATPILSRRARTRMAHTQLAAGHSTARHAPATATRHTGMRQRSCCSRVAARARMHVSSPLPLANVHMVGRSLVQYTTQDFSSQTTIQHQHRIIISLLARSCAYAWRAQQQQVGRVRRACPIGQKRGGARMLYPVAYTVLSCVMKSRAHIYSKIIIIRTRERGHLISIAAFE